MGTSEKSRSIDHISTPVHQRWKHLGEVRGVILQIRVLNENIVSRRLRKAGTKRRPFAPIPPVENLLKARIAKRVQNLSRSVGGTIIDDDELDVEAGI